MMMQPAISSEIAPTGKLRCAAIGIRVLGGVGEPIGKFIADTLSVPFYFVRYPNPEAYGQSFKAPEWDIAIGPRVLAPADLANVTDDVWLIDLLYLAAAGQAFGAPDEVDRPGVKVGTIQNSPSDRFLTRTLKSAELVRLPLSPNFPADAIDMLRSARADVLGADAGLIELIANGYPEAKVVAGAFHTVRVALALPKVRSAAAQAKLDEVVKEVKRSGIVQKAIEHVGLRSGVRVAPECQSAEDRFKPHVRSMSALPPKADIGTQPRNVRYVRKVETSLTLTLFAGRARRCKIKLMRKR